MAIRLCVTSSMILAFWGLLSCQPSAQTKPTAKGEQKLQSKTVELKGSWEQDIKQKLQDLISEKAKGSKTFSEAKPPVAVFDFDNTSIHGDIGRAFFDWMILHQKFLFTDELFNVLPEDKREEIKKAWQELQKLPKDKRAKSVELQKFRKYMHQAYWSLCHETSPEKCYPWQVRFYAGYSPEQIRTMAQKVFEYELSRPLGSEPIKAGKDDPAPAITSTGIRINEEILDLMAILQDRGFQVWIVTAGPQWVVQGAAKRFNLDPKRIIGMRTVLKDGKLTTEMEPPPTFRKGKVQAIEKFIGYKPVLAVGDSWTDADMLEYAEHAILIDRGYEDLKKKAFDSGWWVQPTFATR